MKDEKMEDTRKVRNAESITIEFGLDYYQREMLKGKIFAAEIYDTNTGKPLSLYGNQAHRDKDRLFFTYTGGKVKLTFLSEKRDKDANYAFRLYYFPTVMSIDEGKNSDFDIEIRESLFLRDHKSPKVISAQKAQRTHK